MNNSDETDRLLITICDRDFERLFEISAIDEVTYKETKQKRNDLKKSLEFCRETTSLTIEEITECFERFLLGEINSKPLNRITSSRSGFINRKPWESDKDDPSTYGGYLSKRRRKKKNKC